MAQQGTTPRDPVGVAAAYDRPGPPVTDEQLPAGRRGSLSVVQAVQALYDPTFAGNPEADDILITEQDEATARLVIALAMALGPPLMPTGAPVDREVPAETFTTRAIVFPDATTVAMIAGEDYDRRRLQIFLHAGRIFLGPTRESVENAVQDNASGAFSLTGGTGSNIVLETTAAVWCKLVNNNTVPATVYVLSERGNTRNVPDLGQIHHDAKVPGQPRHSGHRRDAR